MSRNRQLLSVIVIAVIGAAMLAVPASGKPHKVKKASGKQGKVTICHKPTKPAEKTLRVGAPAVPAHLRHGDVLGACPEFDQIIDADGTATAQSGDPGAREVTTGDLLATFPDGFATFSGLDMFDQDSNQAWTQGVDDLHLEDPSMCPTAPPRDGDHDLGLDCKVLDINGDLADQEPVDCDLEEAVSFFGMPCPPPGVKYHDANGNGSYDDGEDIVLDVNNNGVFD